MSIRSARRWTSALQSRSHEIWQLGEFREARAVPDLKRIAAFAPNTKDRGFGGDRRETIDAANEVLLEIAPPA